MKNNFLKKEITESFNGFKNPPLKLIEFCNCINNNYSKKSYLGVYVFSRAILDYIPTIFGFSETSQIYSAPSGQKTFKKALKTLDMSTRPMADDILHNQATLNEIIKVDKTSCDFIKDNLVLVLEGVINQLKSNDLRTDFPSRKDKVIQKPKSQLELFEKYIKDKKSWNREFINDKEVWIYSKDNLYQIHNVDDYSDFSEPWTQVWPDARGSGKHSIDLRFNGIIIKQFTSIYFDGGRENIIMPKIETSTKSNFWEGKDIFKGAYKNTVFYIVKDSIEYHLSQLIGSKVERVAKRSNIEIR